MHYAHYQFLFSFPGVAPPSFVAIQAGQTLHTLASTSDAWSWTSITVLTLFALLSLVPVLMKKKLREKFDWTVCCLFLVNLFRMILFYVNKLVYLYIPFSQFLLNVLSPCFLTIGTNVCNKSSVACRCLYHRSPVPPVVPYWNENKMYKKWQPLC